MGRVIIYFNGGGMTSMKCKSQERAKEITDKRPNVKSWTYYENNEIIPRLRPQQKIEKKLTLAEMEAMISKL